VIKEEKGRGVGREGGGERAREEELDGGGEGGVEMQKRLLSLYFLNLWDLCPPPFLPPSLTVVGKGEGRRGKPLELAVVFLATQVRRLEGCM
jgi:hypothetical protein